MPRKELSGSETSTTLHPNAQAPHPRFQLNEAIHQPVRLSILGLLVHSQRVEFAFLRDHLGLKDANLSQHLTILRSRQILVKRRDGNQVIYSLSNPLLGQVLDIMRRYCQANLKDTIQMLGEMKRGERH